MQTGKCCSFSHSQKMKDCRRIESQLVSSAYSVHKVSRYTYKPIKLVPVPMVS